jgi:tetratricopeptide (TPR) repeat protein
MTSILRAWPALLAATALTSCVSVPADDEPSVYGAFLAARYAGVNRDAAGAADYYMEALDRLPGNAVLTDRAFITSVIAGDFDRAAELSVAASQAGDPSRLATLYHVSDRLARHDYRGALTALEGGPDYGPYNSFFRDILQQWALMGAGRSAEALQAAGDMQAPGFLAPHLWLHKAMLFEAAGNPAAAEAAYRSAVFTSTFRRLATEMYGGFLLREGRRDEAVALFQTYLDDDPSEASIQALQDAAAAGARAPRRPDIPGLAARAVLGPTADLAAQADMDLTVIYMRMVERLDPDLAPLHVVLAGTLDRIGLHQLALAEYASVPDGPFRLGAEVDRTVLMATLGQVEAAHDAAQDLAERTGEPEAILLYADMARISGEWALAAELYGRAMTLNRERGLPDDWRYHYFRASCLLMLGEWDEAEAEYLDALDLAPNQSTVLNDLGYMWIDRGERVDEAFDMISRAAQMTPENGNVVDSLGWAYYQLGHYELAVQELERATELNPGSATANFHLGDAYWQVGRVLEAGFQWRRALDLNPSEAEREALEYRLEHNRPPEHTPVYAAIEETPEAGEAAEP